MTAYKDMQDAAKGYSDAAVRLGKARGYLDGTHYALGAMQSALVDAMQQMGPAERMVFVRTLNRWSKGNNEEAKEKEDTA